MSRVSGKNLHFLSTITNAEVKTEEKVVLKLGTTFQNRCQALKLEAEILHPIYSGKKVEEKGSQRKRLNGVIVM